MTSALAAAVAESGDGLLLPLQERLPGLAHALDVEVMAKRLHRALLHRRSPVEGLRAVAFWMRDDGTCDVRYEVQLGRRGAGSPPEHVLARVHPDAASAATFLDRSRQRLAVPGHEGPADRDWRRHVGIVPAAGMTLSVFP
jgi:hypothetical protein